MRYRILLVGPLLVAAALAVALGAVDDPNQRRLLLRVEIELVKLLALAGCATAAVTFARGDYLRRAWALQALCYLLLLTRDATYLAQLRLGPRLLGIHLDYWHAALVLAGNAAAVLGSWRLARAGQIAGIHHPESRMRRRVVLGITIAVALAIAGPSLVIDLKAVLDGETGAVVPLASDVGDIISLCFIAPVMMTAIALRGGLLAWPWTLLTASMLGWLLYDGAHTLGHFVQFGPQRLRALGEVFRALACTYALGAGVAQRLVVRSSASSPAAPA